MDLHDILNHQKNMLKELETQINVLESRDVAKENESLKAKLEKLVSEFEVATQNSKDLKEKNSRLTDALYEQAYNEKINILDKSQERLSIFFKNEQAGAQNRLTLLENNVQSRIKAMRQILINNHVAAANEIFKKLDEFSDEVKKSAIEARKAYANKTQPFSEAEAVAYAELRNEQITQEQIIDLTKKNNIERFVGLNILNGLGILLIIIGVIAAGMFVQAWLTDEIRAVLIFVLGVVMLTAGEIMNRKKANAFSLGITAGGIAVLFVGLVVSYFGLEVLPMYPALGLTVVITAVAFYLSTRYKSQSLLVLSFIGGYLPIFSITPSPEMVYSAMVYFITLNLLDLLVSIKFKWTVSAYIGLFFNIVSTVYIIGLANAETFHSQIIVFAFVVFAFFIYTAIPVASTYKTNAKFTRSDVVLIGINTFVSCVGMYVLFYNFRWDDLTGLLALIFAVVYLTFSMVLWKKFKDAESMRDLFFITGMVFVVLIVPFQFGADSLVLGWVLQGVSVAVYGILKSNPRFRLTGLVIFGLCISAFLIGDILFLIVDSRIDGLNYFAVTFGGLAILAAYVYKGSILEQRHLIFKYVALLNLWLYALFIVDRYVVKLIRQALWPYIDIVHPLIHNMDTDIALVRSLLMLSVTLVFGFAFPRIKNVADKGVRYIGMGFYILGIFGLFGLNFISVTDGIFGSQLTLSIIAGVALGVVCVASVFAMYDFLIQVAMELRRGIQFLPVILSSYALIILTQYLTTQHNFSFSSMWISFIYVAAAFACIVFGFTKRYIFMRRFGLCLVLLSVAKLFLLDLSWLSAGWRILSYFVLGAVLLAISYIYQFFSKRLEMNTSTLEKEEEHNV